MIPSLLMLDHRGTKVLDNQTREDTGKVLSTASEQIQSCHGSSSVCFQSSSFGRQNSVVIDRGEKAINFC